jgi:polysaccharide export outer membrane protein
VTIPDQVVPRDGAISIPFADRIPVAGKSPVEAQRIIEQRLAEKAIEPQALVFITKSIANSVTVSGEVVTGARVPLSVNGDHLLDVIGLAGGAKAPVYDTFVRLSREGVTATIPMEQLVWHPTENIYAWPGDVLTLVSVPQTFSVLGATGTNMQVNFGAQKITLAEALAKAGGLLDLRADPAGVFLFRFERPAVVWALKVPPLAIGPDGTSPVVYRLDLSDANSYFFAQRFSVEDKDIIPS